MSDEQPPQSIVEALGDEGLAKFEAAGERLSLEAGTALAEPGDPVDDLYLILSGSIEVFLVLEGGVERLVGTLRNRGLLGALAIAQPMTSRARSRTAEPTEVIRISRDAIHQLMSSDAELALALYPALVTQICVQARIAIEDLVNTAQWAAQVSGITQVSFGDLLSSPQGVTLQLLDGRTLKGRVVRLDLQDSGGYLVLDDGEGTLHVVRGAAIVSIERPPISGPSA